MSLAESSSAAASNFRPLQKWYLLFPENWAQLAFEREWRRLRLGTLIDHQQRQAYQFWGILGITWFMVIWSSVGGLFDPTHKQNAGVTAILIATALSVLAYQSMIFLTAQFERIVLQVIDRLDREQPPQ